MLSVISGFLVLVFFTVYIISLLRKKTVPVIVSWIVWAVNDSALTISMHHTDGASGFMIGSAIGSILVMVLSFHFGKIKWSAIDISCGIISLAGIWLSYRYKEPRIFIALGLMVAVLSSIPTIRFMIEKPEEESRLAWLCYYIATWCSIAAIDNWSFAKGAVPVTFMVIGTYCQYLLWRPRKPPQ